MYAREAGVTAFLSLWIVGTTALTEEVLTPVIVGDWWQVASDPDLGDYTRPEQQPVDFGVWQAADGTWQLWSCIRKTGCGGNTRLFYRWEGQNLTDEHWNLLQRVQVDCSAWVGKEVFIRIVDKATGGWGHINFGGMYEDPMKLFSY